MSASKQLRLERQVVARQKQVVDELNSIVQDIERCERTVLDLQEELTRINLQFQGPRTTRDDVEYLSGLLACAKKKLGWEKQLASLQKRTPSTLQELATLLDDPHAPPSSEAKDEMLRALQKVQASMERLQALKVN